MAREETSVLDRELFRPKSRGIEELPESEDNGDLKARQEQALAMIEAAKQKFDPANFQTLSEQSRPGVFRPAAVNMPAQQQTATTAQRMQQMSQMGMRPVGMAKGGLPLEGYSPYEMSQFLAERGAANLHSNKRDYDLPSYDPETMKPTLSVDEPVDLLTDEEKAAVEKTRAPKEAGPSRSFADKIRELELAREEEKAREKQAREDEEISTYFMGKGRSRESLRPPVSSWDTFNPGRAVDEWTEKKIEEQAANPPSKTIPSGQFVRPEYPRTLTREELAVKKAQEEGVPVATPGASAGPSTAPAAAAAPEGVAGLIGGGRGQTVERPGERADYLRSRAEGNLPSTATPPATKGGVGGAGAGTDANHPTNLSDIKKDREDAFNMALIQAGLAMMAGKSSNALANIGEGGLAGLQAYTNQLGQSRARALEERKLNMMESYYGSREKALEAAGVRHMDAMNRIKLDAMKAADAAVATELKANPTMAKRDADLLRQQTYDRYMGAIANNAEYTSSAPELNPEATSILGD